MARHASLGTVRYLPNVKLFRARATITDSLGKRVRRDWYGKTEDEARQKMVAEMAARDRGDWSANKTPTIEQWLNDWFPTLDLKPTSLTKYRESIDLHIVPNLGPVKLSELKPSHINAFQAKLKNSGLAPATIQRVKTVLGQSLKAAVNDELISRNVVSLSRPVKQAQAEQPIFTPGQQMQLFNSEANHQDIPLWKLLAHTGMRISEASGLRWGDIDLTNREINIRRQLMKEKGEWLVLTPKTTYSTRTVPMSDEVYATLIALKMVTKLPSAMTPVFIPESRLAILKRLQSALGRAGLPNYHLHTFRHSYGSILLDRGVPLPEVSKLLGHANVQITARVYAHQLNRNSTRSVAVLNEVFATTKKEEIA